MIRKAKSLINMPVVGWLINKYGSKEQLLNELNRLEQLFEPNGFNQVNNSPMEQAPVSELEQMQANLARLK